MASLMIIFFGYEQHAIHLIAIPHNCMNPSTLSLFHLGIIYLLEMRNYLWTGMVHSLDHEALEHAVGIKGFIWTLTRNGTKPPSIIDHGTKSVT